MSLDPKSWYPKSWYPKSWYPKSLAGQFALLLIGAVMVGHVVTFWIVEGEREEAVRSTARQFVVTRTASVYRLLAETPQTLHPNLIRAASSPAVGYRLGPKPQTRSKPKTRLERGIAQALRRELDLADNADLRVRVIERGWGKRHWRDNDDGDDDDHPPRRRAPARLHMSIPLEFQDHSRWLNVRIGSPPGPPAWAWASLLSLLIASGGIVIITMIMTRRITRPLSALADAANRFSGGVGGQEIAPQGTAEVRHTIEAFNAMQRRISDFVRDRTQMLAAMGHDLRTPITSLRLQAEFVEDDETREKIIQIVEEMQAMAEATLAFAKEDAKAEDLRRTDLRALIQAIVADAVDRGLAVRTSDLDHAVASIRVQAVKRAIRNLIENACRYGDEAMLSLTIEGGECLIAVEDRGPGIPDDRLDDVFEPFVRLEQSRSRETGGAGLGLSIVRTIVQSHGGTVTLKNREGGGLCAVIRLPLGGAVR